MSTGSIFRRSRLAATKGRQATTSPIAANAAHLSSVPVQMSPVQQPKENSALLSRLEELEVALDTAHAVNRHLNAEVEGLVMELDKLRREKQQYERHIEELAALLHNEKHRTAALVAQVKGRNQDGIAIKNRQNSQGAALPRATSLPHHPSVQQHQHKQQEALQAECEPMQDLAGETAHSATAGLASDAAEPHQEVPGEHSQAACSPDALSLAEHTTDFSTGGVSPPGASPSAIAAERVDGQDLWGDPGVQQQQTAANTSQQGSATASADLAEPLQAAGALEAAGTSEAIAHSWDTSMPDACNMAGQMPGADPLAIPGQQDITPQSILCGAGEAADSGMTSSSVSAADAWQFVEEVNSGAGAAGPAGQLATVGHASSFVPPPVIDLGEGMEWVQDPRWEHLRAEAQAASWLISPEELQLGPQIGQGAFGTSFRGTWRGVTVAVKCVRVQTITEAETFLREVEVLASLRHPNLLPFYGACLWPLDHCWLITEYMTGGTLQGWLYGGPNKQGTILQPQRSLLERLHMALDVARGMEALEESDPPVVHRDLKPSNVFIDASGRARVADFGLSRRLTQGCAAELTGETGTYMYMSPEMMRHELYDSKTDVYSWGIMLVELVLQRNPYDKLYLSPVQANLAVQIALAVAEGKLHAADLLPNNTNPSVAALAAMCLEQEPELRPTFGLVVQELTMAMDEVKQQLATQQKGAIGRFFSRRGDGAGKENEKN